MADSDSSTMDAVTPLSSSEGNGNWCRTDIKVYKSDFKWRITNFCHAPCQMGEFLESAPVYTGKELTWCVRLFPRGIDDTTPGWVSLQLVSNSIVSSSVFVIGKFWVINADGATANEHRFERTFSGDQTVHCIDKFIEFGKFGGSEDTLILYVALEVSWNATVTCGEMRRTSSHDGNAGKASRTGFLARDFGALHKDRKYSDIILKSGDEEFPAHKLILAARSSVLADRIYGNSNEDIGFLVIDDVSVEVLRLMLTYIYTGKICRLSIWLTADVMSGAKRYRLDGLSSICKHRLQESITAENASQMLRLAEESEDVELRKTTLRFLLNDGIDMALFDDIGERTDVFKSVVSALSALLLRGASSN